MKKTIRKTKSVCPICIKEIDAYIVEENNKIFMEKECSEHGRFKILLSSHARYYKELNKINTNIRIPNLDIDSLVLLFLTQRCDLNCPICYTNTKEEYREPTLKDIKRALRKFKNTEIALFGGEPTARKDLLKIIKEIKTNNILLLVTNGIKLANIDYLKELKKAGVKIILLQFDGFNDQIYKKLRGKKLLNIKKKALDNLKKLNISTSLEVAVCKGVNDKELAKIFDYALKNSFIKQVCFRSYGFLGRKKISYEKMLTIDQMIDSIEKGTKGRITKEDILDFEKLLYVLKEIFSFIPIDLCLYAQDYFTIRGKNSFETPQDIINFRKLEKTLNEYIKSKKRKRIDRLKLVLKLLSSINYKRISLVAKILLPILLKKIIGKRTDLSEMPRELLILRFSLMCEPYRFDYYVANKCTGYEIRNNKIYKSRAICNILREKSERVE